MKENTIRVRNFTSAYLNQLEKIIEQYDNEIAEINNSYMRDRSNKGRRSKEHLQQLEEKTAEFENYLDNFRKGINKKYSIQDDRNGVYKLLEDYGLASDFLEKLQNNTTLSNAIKKDIKNHFGKTDAEISKAQRASNNDLANKIFNVFFVQTPEIDINILKEYKTKLSDFQINRNIDVLYGFAFLKQSPSEQEINLTNAKRDIRKSLMNMVSRLDLKDKAEFLSSLNVFFELYSNTDYGSKHLELLQKKYVEDSKNPNVNAHREWVDEILSTVASHSPIPLFVKTHKKDGSIEIKANTAEGGMFDSLFLVNTTKYSKEELKKLNNIDNLEELLSFKDKYEKLENTQICATADKGLQIEKDSIIRHTFANIYLSRMLNSYNKKLNNDKEEQIHWLSNFSNKKQQVHKFQNGNENIRGAIIHAFYNKNPIFKKMILLNEENKKDQLEANLLSLEKKSNKTDKELKKINILKKTIKDIEKRYPDFEKNKKDLDILINESNRNKTQEQINEERIKAKSFSKGHNENDTISTFKKIIKELTSDGIFYLTAENSVNFYNENNELTLKGFKTIMSEFKGANSLFNPESYVCLFKEYNINNARAIENEDKKKYPEICSLSKESKEAIIQYSALIKQQYMKDNSAVEPVLLNYIGDECTSLRYYMDKPKNLVKNERINELSLDKFDAYIIDTFLMSDDCLKNNNFLDNALKTAFTRIVAHHLNEDVFNRKDSIFNKYNINKDDFLNKIEETKNVKNFFNLRDESLIKSYDIIRKAKTIEEKDRINKEQAQEIAQLKAQLEAQKMDKLVSQAESQLSEEINSNNGKDLNKNTNTNCRMKRKR